MAFFDLSREELFNYLPNVQEPDDFDSFWARTLATHCPKGEVVLTPVECGLSLIDVWDVTFPGFDGHPVRAWFMLPAGTSEPLPGVVEFVGYEGGRGLPHEHLAWTTAGYAYLIMDTRGQGSGWGGGGQTPDPAGAGPSTSGFMTRGIEAPEEYYYRRVFVDAVRAVETIRSLPHVDPSRVAVTGGSQGGGIAIAAAGLANGLVGAMPDVPFLCHFGRAVGFTDTDPYSEIVRYLSVHRTAEEQVFRTLSYFDGANFAKRASAPAIFSVAHLDVTCPPSTVFAARNRWAVGEPDIVEYRFNQHEGGGPYQWPHQAEWLASQLKSR